MNRKKIFRRGFIAFFSVIFLLSAVVGATVKLYTVSAEDYPSEVESMDISKQRALEKAVKKAKKEAGVYLKTYSRSVNCELTDDEIIAITSNSYKIVGEPKYTREIVNHSDETSIIVWKVNVDVQVDDSEIQSWIKRDDKEKSTIISQTRDANKASDENERKIEDLREKYNRATSQAERDSIIKQMHDADREFLANQKLEEGIRLAFQGKSEEAIKIYSDVIKLSPTNASIYNARGYMYNCLAWLKKYKDLSTAKKLRVLALEDYNKAIQLKSNYSEAYGNRGKLYSDSRFFDNDLRNTEQSLKDFNRAIELDPANGQNYVYRSLYYRYELKDKERGLADLNKAVEVEPNNSRCYQSRALFYQFEENYTLAIDDFTQAIKFEKIKVTMATEYYNRGECYQKLKMYDKAIDDYTRAIELGENEELMQSLLPYIYSHRKECYTALGK